MSACSARAAARRAPAIGGTVTSTWAPPPSCRPAAGLLTAAYVSPLTSLCLCPISPFAFFPLPSVLDRPSFHLLAVVAGAHTEG
jgi:hypothetical protein